MDADAILEQVLRSSAVERRPPHPGLHALSEELRQQNMALPRSHLRLLAATDGALAYHGYFRIFGTDRLRRWNSLDYWQFAWPKEILAYHCFGETGWGDQYAYLVCDLQKDGEPPVYFLEAITLQPERLSDSFDHFLAMDFLRNATAPYDSMLLAAAGRVGPICDTEHIVHTPSPLITGDERVGDVVRMPARAAMIAKGDLATQLARELSSRVVDRIEHYSDELHRPRLRVVWADG